MKASWYALGAFDDPETIVEAARALRQELPVQIDAHTPYPIDALEEALELRPSRVRWVALAGGLVGAVGAYVTLWYANALDYPLNIGGRPLNAVPAFIPITFEMAVLVSAGAIFLGVLALSGLPRLYHPAFDVEGFSRASIDRFWISIPASNRTEAEGYTIRLRVLGAREVHLTETRTR
ncbi:MAG: DUF3341 domain-containing protein [Myxococcaceae bacterium]